jgi:GNAT superfamily N-acetyltransferase
MLRIVQIEDVSEILSPYCELIEAVGWETRDRKVMLEALNRSLAVVAVYEDSKLVGAARLVGDGIYNLVLYDMVVHPQFRRKGVGTAILNHSSQYAERLGVPRLECICEAGNSSFYMSAEWKSTTAFYKELGIK